jgi:hypothetical protein
MKTMILFLAVMTMFLFSCRKDKNVDLPSNSDNLIANPSFETISHQPDYSGWTGTAYLFDSLGHQNFPLVQDAPQGGGLWCVQVEPLWAPQEGFTETMLTGQTGTHNYQLTLWMKTIHWRGLISLEQWRNGQLIDDKNLSDTSSLWKRESLVNTMMVLPTDTLKIHFSAGYTEMISGQVRFDNVKLEIINP